MSEASGISVGPSSLRVDRAKAKGSVAIAVCGLTIILALVIGVGVPGGLVLRHIVQTLPFWAVVWLGFRHSRLTGWVGLPLFLFWFAAMALIWLYLFGIAHVLSGHFSGVEKAMTLIVGIASLVAIGFFVLTRTALSAAKAITLFIALAAIQWICFRISFLPEIAHR